MRTDYISWYDFFMGVAKLAAQRSKDDSTQNGAVIVDNNNVIVGVGYNGLPVGEKDTPTKWSRPLKYDLVIHAEDNALLNSFDRDLTGCSLYLWSSRNFLPCQCCAEKIVKSGVKVVYCNGFPDEHHLYDWGYTQTLFEDNGIELFIDRVKIDLV